MKSIGYVVAGALVWSLAGVVAAQSNTAGLDQRQANQARRIDQGQASGQLTPKEAKRLDRQENRIERMESRAKADGVVTPRERAHLARTQTRESHRIARQKHDRQHDFNHDGRVDRPHRR